MTSLREYLEDSADEIEELAQQYAIDHKCSIEDARRDVRDEFVQGYCEGAEASRTTDWDYGRE